MKYISLARAAAANERAHNYQVAANYWEKASHFARKPVNKQFAKCRAEFCVKKLKGVIMVDKLLNRNDVAKYLGYKYPKSIDRLVRECKFPKADHYIGKSPRWSESLVSKGIQSLSNSSI